MSEADLDAVREFIRAFNVQDLDRFVSVLDDESLDRLRDAIWALTGLIRVFVRRPGENAAEPQPLHPPASVVDVARTIHYDLAESCTGARIWGPSARFDAQRVGREHVVADGAHRPQSRHRHALAEFADEPADVAAAQHTA